MCSVRFSWSTDLRRAGAAAELAFDHFAEAGGSVGVLALQVFADGHEFHRIDVLHDQGAIGEKSTPTRVFSDQRTRR